MYIASRATARKMMRFRFFRHFERLLLLLSVSRRLPLSVRDWRPLPRFSPGNRILTIARCFESFHDFARCALHCSLDASHSAGHSHLSRKTRRLLLAAVDYVILFRARHDYISALPASAASRALLYYQQHCHHAQFALFRALPAQHASAMFTINIFQRGEHFRAFYLRHWYFSIASSWWGIEDHWNR